MTYDQGDTKGAARGADGAPKRDTVGTQLSSDAQVTYISLTINYPLQLFQ